MSRKNFLEETFYSFSYSPIRDENGKVVGLFCPSTGTTSKLLSERCLKMLNELSAKTLLEKTVENVFTSTIKVLAANEDYIPSRGLAHQRITQALILPLSVSSNTALYGVLVVGINPCRQLTSLIIRLFLNRLLDKLQQQSKMPAPRSRKKTH